MTWLAAFLAALPYAAYLGRLIAADRAARRKHEAAIAKEAGK